MPCHMLLCRAVSQTECTIVGTSNGNLGAIGCKATATAYCCTPTPMPHHHDYGYGSYGGYGYGGGYNSGYNSGYGHREPRGYPYNPAYGMIN